MKVYKDSHHFGEYVIPSHIQKPLTEFIQGMSFIVSPRSSQGLRMNILNELQNNQGWSSEVKIQHQQGLTITSLKQKTGLCIQTGNMSRFYADLLKLQALYLKDKIDSAIYIIPSKEAARILGDNIANSERFNRELNLFKHIITVPILVLTIE